MVSDKLKVGDHYVQDDLTGRKRHASECALTWDGLFVHKSLPQGYFNKHPQLEAAELPIPAVPEVIRSNTTPTDYEPGSITPDNFDD